MKIAIASGKGGTGKTFISTILFKSLNKQGKNVKIADLDVECPDTALFLDDLKLVEEKVLNVKKPIINKDKCTNCNKCVEVCNFKAFASSPDKPIFFEELCKSCMRCVTACPEKCIDTYKHKIGVVSQYEVLGTRFVEGRLTIGEIASASLIREVKNTIEDKNSDFIIYDCPPGTTCPMVHSVSNADYCLIVMEDSPFGVSDGLSAKEVLDKMGVPCAVVINKYKPENSLAEIACKRANIEVIARIEYSKEIHISYTGKNDAMKIKSVADAVGRISDFLLQRSNYV